MRCYCCEKMVPIARKVKIRVLRESYPPCPKGSALHKSIEEETTFRWAVICEGCYHLLDNYYGGEEIGSRFFNIAGISRGDRAAVYNEKKYRAFQRREAAKLGIDLPEE